MKFRAYIIGGLLLITTSAMAETGCPCTDLTREEMQRLTDAATALAIMQGKTAPSNDLMTACPAPTA